MTERTTESSVTFLHAFALRDVDEMQPPGTYRIETVEEPINSLSFLAFRRVSTTITLPALGTATLRKQDALASTAMALPARVLAPKGKHD